jgi:hypothetical protein
MRQNAAQTNDDHRGIPDHEGVPKKGDRIELRRSRAGVFPRGTVYHVDQVQILVKWDDGRSESLRPGVDAFRIVGRG